MTIVNLRPATLICFSHLRWDFVFQRPQHLMTRFARDMRVFFVEEPLPAIDGQPSLELRTEPGGVTVAVPRIPEGCDVDAVQRGLLDQLRREHAIHDPILWYYTPMAGAFSDHLPASAVVYDCMDELSAFRFAPPALLERERALFRRADLVFTGGYSLYEAKRALHPHVHPFPSSVDAGHFGSARERTDEPADQAPIPRPRLGFFGVIDERMDQALLAAVADARPDWQIVMVGPIVKIDPAELPRRPNIHYLGGKSYPELPAYLAGWDVALMPFVLNESTRFISPTKTPEYLAGGKPVVSTAITDVIRHYGDLEAVRIARTPDEFVAASEAALARNRAPGPWLEPVERVLAEMSWDTTWQKMARLIEEVRTPQPKPPAGTRPLGPVGSKPFAPGRDLDRRGAERPLGPVGAKPFAPHIRPSRRSSGFDYLIVGAGYAGSVLAERLAAGSNKRVLLIDRRPHIGGNAYDHRDAAGVMIHRYGPHIFHTNSRQIVDYLSRFTSWRRYEHRVLAHTNDMLVPMPINRTTINRLYGLNLASAEVEDFLAARAEVVATVRTSEDVVVSKVGRELYERFFRGYTRKQWGMDPSELDKCVTSRVPTRTNDDDRYFTDSFQNMPLHGYTRMFENMLDHPNIEIVVGTDFSEINGDVSYDRLIYSGPIDEFFGYRYGKLAYRSLAFRHETLDQERFQPVAVVNYPAPDVPYTRITEYKHLTGQSHAKTSISYEFPRAEGDPYYPVPKPENAELYKKYQALADATPDVEFVGRLATYRYYNMDQVVGQALALYARLSGARVQRAEPAQATARAAG